MFSSRRFPSAVFAATACLLLAGPEAWALNPRKTLTQYTRTVWTQEQGLPQDTIRAIAQTSDGYLWLGTDEGLARFDGYEFVVFNKDRGDLPSNSVTALFAGARGDLWIGTADGLAHYQHGRFTRYTVREGLPDDAITAVYEDRAGGVWIVAGIYLSRFENGRFTSYRPGQALPLQAVRVVYEDREGNFWASGFGGVAKLVNGRFVTVVGPEKMDGDIVSALLEDHLGNLWVAGSKGLLVRSPEGKLRLYDSRDGLPDSFVRALWEDRDGNLWAGTNAGLARLEGGRFVTATLDRRDRDWVRCILEDREGNLWVGLNSGLNRFRDDMFTFYSRTEGLPSDEPTTVRPDGGKGVWIGFHDSGLVHFAGGRMAAWTRRDGLASNEIFSIRQDRREGLLIGTREGVSRMEGGRFRNFIVEDSLARRVAFDALEDRRGRIWVAAPGGLYRIENGRSDLVLPGGAMLNNAFVVLEEGRDGSLWAGTYGQGLWRLKEGRNQLFTVREGLANNQIRALVEDPDGTLWIGTFGGGLAALGGGAFRAYTSRQGLLSDNISHIEDDGRGSLWLSTTRGICRVSKRQLRELDSGALKTLTPTNYGVEDGLRSAQCAPGYPTGGGGTRTADGRLWFPTSQGLAVLDPSPQRAVPGPGPIHVLEVSADGRRLDPGRAAELQPGVGRVQFRYAAIHLAAPERVRYSFKLEGLDRDWVQSVVRRVANYNSLPQGNYRFVVRAAIGGGPSAAASYSFQVLPHVYETRWFLWLCGLGFAAAILAGYQLRLRQVRGRFALVLEERARLAREIHDTLAQGFVGISSQLDAVAIAMPDAPGPARQFLELARKMARHSLTEARRAVMDLRASALETQDLPEALESGARQWTAGAPVAVHVDVSGPGRRLAGEMEQDLLRIAQEAVGNALKHAGAARIGISLGCDTDWLRLRVEDDGKGFDPLDAFSALGGHFGLIGMRERAERLGGELKLYSRPGAGTQVEVVVPWRKFRTRSAS